MSKRKGQSAQDERRSNLLSVFHESADVFTLKDVEKMGSKQGITFQNFKEALQSLLDDDLVHMEKMGSTNYYWAFSGHFEQKVTREAAKVDAELAQAKKRRTQLAANVDTERGKRKGEEKRGQLTAELGALRKQIAETELCSVLDFTTPNPAGGRTPASLEGKPAPPLNTRGAVNCHNFFDDASLRSASAWAAIAQYAGNDPATVEAMRQGAGVARDSANRWLDNIQSLVGWCKKSFPDQPAEAIESFLEENGYSKKWEYL